MKGGAWKPVEQTEEEATSRTSSLNRPQNRAQERTGNSSSGTDILRELMFFSSADRKQTWHLLVCALSTHAPCSPIVFVSLFETDAFRGCHSRMLSDGRYDPRPISLRCHRTLGMLLCFWVFGREMVSCALFENSLNDSFIACNRLRTSEFLRFRVKNRRLLRSEMPATLRRQAEIRSAHSSQIKSFRALRILVTFQSEGKQTIYEVCSE